MNKPTEVCDLVLTEKLDVLAITEAWLRGDARDGPALADIQSTLQDFHLLKLPRKGKRGGGICVLVRNLYSTSIKHHAFETFECLEVRINSTNQAPVSLIVIYRPPSREQSVTSFLQEFSRLLEVTNLWCGHLMICGDLNIHVDNVQDADAKSLLDLLESTGLQQKVFEPAHTHGHTLDLLLVRESDDSIKDVTVLSAMPSDHAAVTFTAALSRPAEVKKINVRNLQGIDYETFKDDITSCFAAIPNIEELSVEEKVELYNSTLSDTLDKHAPASAKCVHLRPHAPWYNASLKKLKQTVRAKERKWKSCKSTINQQLLKDALREYQSALKHAKRTYHRDKISSCDQKELFRTVRKLTV